MRKSPPITPLRGTSAALTRAAEFRSDETDALDELLDGAEIQSLVGGLDEVVVTLERKWGVGRLRRLVDDDLRLRFDAQVDRFDAALIARRLEAVRVHAGGLRRAWQVLDAAATAAGHAPLSPNVWECVLPSSGEVVSLVRTPEEAHHVADQGRVFTVAEVGVLIEALGSDVLNVKRVFPGASLASVRSKPPDPPF